MIRLLFKFLLWHYNRKLRHPTDAGLYIKHLAIADALHRVKHFV